MSTGLRDRLTFGGSRQRRRINRMLRQMDQLDFRPPGSRVHAGAKRRGAASVAVFLAAIVGIAYALGWVPGGHKRGMSPVASTSVGAGTGNAGQKLSDVLRAEPARNLYLPSAGVDEVATRLLPQVTGPAGTGGYSFLSAYDEIPVRWDPCRPIHYRIRDLPATPPGGDAAIFAAVREASKASGLTFVYDGQTDEAPTQHRAAYQPTHYGDRWAPVLIAWTNPKELPELAGTPFGVASPQPYGTTPADQTYVSGTIGLDTSDLIKLDQKTYRFTFQSVVEHELGHLIGLDHVNDPTQLMNPTTDGQLSYGDGDLRGLAVLGAGACHPEL